MAETINGLYKTEVIYKRGPWKTRESLELATLQWVHWFNLGRLLESLQELLLRLALQMARDDYEDRRERQRQGIELAKEVGKYRGRRADPKLHAQVIALRRSGHRIAKTAELAGCSLSQVKRVWAVAANQSETVP